MKGVMYKMDNKNDLVRGITIVGVSLLMFSTAAIGYGQIKTNNLEKLNRKLTKETKELREHVAETEIKYSKITEDLETLKKDSIEILEQNRELEAENSDLKSKLQIEEEAKKEQQKREIPTEAPNRSGKRLLGNFEATAYDDSVESQGQWVGQTATGMTPQVGVVAVDPNVIPLHTKLYIEGYGYATAGDTGGAIKGNRIDVFKNTRSECREWGRRQVKVYIIE